MLLADVGAADFIAVILPLCDPKPAGCAKRFPEFVVALEFRERQTEDIDFLREY